MPVVNETNNWVEIEGYNLQSMSQFCAVTGSNRKGDRVFRGPMIEFEGYFDISEQSARQLAGLIGFVPSNEADDLRDELAQAEEDIKARDAEITSLRGQVQSLTMQNAELYTQIAALQDMTPDVGEEAAAEEGEDDFVFDDPEFVPLDPDEFEGESDDGPSFDVEAYLNNGVDR